MKSRLATALLAGAASFVLLSACSTPADTEIAAAEAAMPMQAPVLQAEAPTGQLPEGVRPTAYRLDLVTDPNAASFTGHEEIDLALDKPHARIWMHALGPVVSSVKAVLPDGMEIAATFTGDEAADGVSRIDFAAPLPAGPATLVIDYEAPYNLNLAGLYKVEQAGLPYLVTQMEPIDARRMFPSFDEPRFKTPYTLTVTAPEGMEVAANGAETGSEDLGNGMVRHSFATTRPIQSYLVALMVGPYDEVIAEPIPATEVRAEPVPLRGFAAAGKGEKLAAALDITDEMVEWQEAYFDYPYPYGKLDLIAAADFAYGAMENAGAIVYRESALLIDDRTSLARRRAIFNTHAHELGHQWFGNLVTPAWWNDIWLNEAFATWISSKTMNGIDPDGEWDLAPIQSSLTAMPTDSLASTRQIRNPIRTNGDINDAFDSITYRKGGSVLNMFETYLGEDALMACACTCAASRMAWPRPKTSCRALPTGPANRRSCRLSPPSSPSRAFHSWTCRSAAPAGRARWPSRKAATRRSGRPSTPKPRPGKSPLRPACMTRPAITSSGRCCPARAAQSRWIAARTG
ncbi:MAG: M1 family aminopeptidase [Hyphomonas sp.]